MAVNPKLPAWAKLIPGLLLFAAAYGLMNHYLLVQSVLYRLAVWDYVNAFQRLAGFALQALALLFALTFLPRRWIAVVLALFFFSVWLNMGFGLIVGPAIDAAQVSWLVSETMQAGAMGRQFAMPILGAAAIAAAAIALLLAARRYLRAGLDIAGTSRWGIGLAALIAPFVLIDPFRLGPVDASRNGYVHFYSAFMADTGGPRATVTASPAAPAEAEKIVWLIDESIVHSAYAKIVRPATLRHDPVDFGEAHSLGNCSAPANLALRSGIAVDQVNRRTDLRQSPSIWGYARKAGYRTMLIDGQTFGPLHNLILPSERKLIDEFTPAKAGLDTDRTIASRINASLRAPGRTFVYAVLQGAHFQYDDNYPENALPEASPMALQYETAVAYSKTGFFDTLLAGVDRTKVAIFYTSDHGQNVKPGLLPHCSAKPGPSEFSVPLIAFLPQDRAVAYAARVPGQRSHGQMFPASLRLMGYAKSVADHYDNDLMAPSRRVVWFGRKVVPLSSGDEIDLHSTPSREGAPANRGTAR